MANKHDVQLRTQLLEKLLPIVETVDNLDSDNANRPLSARQGKVLKELIESGGGSSRLSIEVVETLPDTGSIGILYLVPKSSYLKEENKYDEYVWVESTGKYELLGSFSTDLDINEIKEILGEISQINVATLSNNGINDYVTTGTYRVYGERINAQDGLPIINAGNGHTVEGILRVYDSSIAGTGKDTDKVVTQILSMSNRRGGDGHIWIRTGQGSNKSNLTWSTWEKLQGIFEKNTITNIGEINTFTTNGMYSCMYVGDDVLLHNILITKGAILLIIVINGYMASSIGLTPKLTQNIILTQPGNNTNYIFTRHATFSNDSWRFQDLSNIVLGSARIIDANIGTAFKDNPKGRINIGTYADSKVNINNAFIGDTINRESDAKSVIICKGVNIDENTIIGHNVDIDNNARIGQTANIGRDVNIGVSASIGQAAKVGKNVNIGANTEYLEKREGHHTSSSYIIANVSNGSRTILSSKKKPPVRKLTQDIYDKADVILVDGEHPETAHQVLDNNQDAISVIDAGRLNDDTRALGKKVTYLVCSKDFAEEFSNKKIDVNNRELLIEIYEELKAYFNTNVIITLESTGSFTKINDVYKIIPSIKVKAIDSTGAGDIFHGAFTYFIGMNYPLEEAIRLASITAAISVTRIGSRFSIPKLEEVLDYAESLQ